MPYVDVLYEFTHKVFLYHYASDRDLEVKILLRIYSVTQHYITLKVPENDILEGSKVSLVREKNL